MAEKHELVELKTRVSQEFHDDFLVIARALGFSDRAKFLRYLAEREVNGVKGMIQPTRLPGGFQGPE